VIVQPIEIGGVDLEVIFAISRVRSRTLAQMEIKIRYNQYWGSGFEILDPVLF
jgi:hypothetical protein